jgi:hypothetical protein
MSEILQNSNGNKDDQQNCSAQAGHCQSGEGPRCPQASRSESQIR